MTDKHLFQGWYQERRTVTARQKMNELSAELMEHAEKARSAGRILFADVLLMSRSNIIEAESILQGYHELINDPGDKPEKTNGVFTP